MRKPAGLESLKGQRREADLFYNVCSAVDDMKLPWNKVDGIVVGGAVAWEGGSYVCMIFRNMLNVTFSYCACNGSKTNHLFYSDRI